MKYLLILFLLVTTCYCHAQSTNHLKEFNASTTKVFVNIIEKIHHCNFSIVMLKIDVDTIGNQKITISENADSILTTELNLAVGKLNLKPLTEYLKENNISKSTFLLSLNFVIITAKCLKPTLSAENLYQANKFMNRSFMGPCIWLGPIGFQMTVQDN